MLYCVWNSLFCFLGIILYIPVFSPHKDYVTAIFIQKQTFTLNSLFSPKFFSSIHSYLIQDYALSYKHTEQTPLLTSDTKIELKLIRPFVTFLKPENSKIAYFCENLKVEGLKKSVWVHRCTTVLDLSIHMQCSDRVSYAPIL